MDSLTQAALGAAVGHLCWRKKLGRKALVTGAVIGTIPDLDIIIYPFLDEVQRLYWHRGESHSVFFVLLASLPTAWILCRIFREKSFGLKTAYGGAFFIYLTHIFIDLFTIYGTQLFAPLSRNGYAIGNFFIIDPLFTFWLIVGIIAALLYRKPWGSRISTAALAIAICYTVWSLTIQSFAANIFFRAAEKQGYQLVRQLTSAGAFTTFLWRNVAETSDGFLLGYWSVFDRQNSTIKFYYIPKNAKKVAAIRDSRTFAVVEWFSKGWWCVIRSDNGTAKVVDMRFGEIPSAPNQPHQEWNWPFAWEFSLEGDNTQPLQAVIPDIVDPLQTLQLLADRIKGGRGWLNSSAEIKVGSSVFSNGEVLHRSN